MCGIVGVVRLSGAPIAERVLSGMARSIVHRGPDDEGFHYDPDAAIGMRRLSIIDVDGGHQPLSDESGRRVLVCNGEIYNYRELRAELAAKGYGFKTEGDKKVRYAKSTGDVIDA